MTTTDIIKGYFDALKKKQDPKKFILLSYSELGLVRKDILKSHADLVKGKETKIEILSEYDETTPVNRTIVEFTINDEKFRAVVMKETKPANDPAQLSNWINENGVPGLNPYSIEHV